MFSCRAAWQRCGSVARGAACRLPRQAVQQRQMSTVPGGSGENILYAVLCGGAFVGALSYTYSTMAADNARFANRIAEMNSRSKAEWVPKPWPPKSKDDEHGGEGEEAPAEEATGVSEADCEAVAEVVAEVSEVLPEVSEVLPEVSEVLPEVSEVLPEVSEVVAVVAGVTQEVQAVAENVAEAVEEAAQEVVAVASEEPESNGTTSSSEEEAAASEN